MGWNAWHSLWKFNYENALAVYYRTTDQHSIQCTAHCVHFHITKRKNIVQLNYLIFRANRFEQIFIFRKITHVPRPIVVNSKSFIMYFALRVYHGMHFRLVTERGKPVEKTFSKYLLFIYNGEYGNTHKISIYNCTVNKADISFRSISA